MSENRRQFWKRSSKVPGSILPVYGAQQPPLDKSFLFGRSRVHIHHTKNKKASSFHEFARNTSDAWDIDDESEDVLHSVSCEAKMADVNDVDIVPHCRLQEENSNQSVTKSASEDQLHKVTADVTLMRKPLKKLQPHPFRPIIPLVARISDQNASGAPSMTLREKTRLEKFRQLLSILNTDLDELRKCSWPGIPRDVRPTTWRLLSGYLPANKDRRQQTLQRKRAEYFGFIEQYYDSRNEEHHQDTYRQIHIDIPRTNPLIPLFQQPLVQEIFERILFIWAIRHPASGYVQGINDLVTPFFVVFLTEHVEDDVENFDVSSLSSDTLRNIEADSFWSISKLLDGIQAEPEGFSHFHLYVCAAFLIKWRKEILDEEDFQGLLMLLQNLPTIHWGNEEIGLLLAEAYRLKYMFADAPNHYRR
ncbi:TBC1 domain family member 22B isoform X5 [Aquarana catesbeiana]|uniref:TBC1 domain family member 22B isoform X5 n=1 Tax=Aquarana catesbeiana TaxID=8400 RepID=UPI003CC9AF8D